MMKIIEFICAVLPAILLIAFIRWKDKDRPEPMKQIVKGFIFGCLSIVLTLVFDSILGIFYVKAFDSVPVLHALYTSFYMAAFSEESAKLIMLWLLLRKCRDFDESLDGIVYAVCIGMGFAAIENIDYVFSEDDWGVTAFVRALLAVPGHYIYAVLMGFFYSLVHFGPEKYGKYRIMIWLAPFLAHGIFDSFIFIGRDVPELGFIASILLIYFCYRMHRFCLSRINSSSLHDQDMEHVRLFEAGMRDKE